MKRIVYSIITCVASIAFGLYATAGTTKTEISTTITAPTYSKYGITVESGPAKGYIIVTNNNNYPVNVSYIMWAHTNKGKIKVNSDTYMNLSPGYAFTAAGWAEDARDYSLELTKVQRIY